MHPAGSLNLTSMHVVDADGDDDDADFDFVHTGDCVP